MASRVLRRRGDGAAKKKDEGYAHCGESSGHNDGGDEEESGEMTGGGRD